MGTVQSFALYYFIIIFTSVILFLSEKIRKSNFRRIYQVIFFISIILPVMVSGFRYGIGTDYFNYVDIYLRLSHSSFIDNIINTRLEPGWILLNHVIKLFFNDVKYLFIITSLLIWVFNFKAIYDNRNGISIGIAALILLSTMYNPSFNGIRQYLAASLLMLSIKPVIDRKPLKFVLSVLFATSIHYTSLIFIPAYWIANSRTGNAGLIKKNIAIVGSILMVLLAPYLLSFITKFDAFSTYSNYQLNFQDFGIGNIILKLPVILIILFNMKKLKSYSPMNKLVIFYFISLIFEYYGYFAQYAERIALYYEMIQVFILAAIVKVQTNKYERLFYSFIIIFYFLAWFTYYIIILNNHQTIPYTWR